MSEAFEKFKDDQDIESIMWGNGFTKTVAEKLVEIAWNARGEVDAELIGHYCSDDKITIVELQDAILKEGSNE